jgi:energy-coupling factor transporter ATP-binding protein EcfA2
VLKKIELTNFMSHSHSTFELVDGLNVIVGENNCGKSAIVAALEALCENERGDYMVRHGQSECVVRVETAEGHSVEWRRKKKTVSYVINDEPIHRLGGGVPDELHDFLKLPLVQAEPDDFNIHFGEQKEPIFLLNQSASRRAQFFASSSDAIKLIRMQRLHKEHVSEERKRVKKLQKLQTSLRQRIAQTESIPALEQKLAALDETVHDINRANRSISRLRELIGTVDGQKTQLQRFASQHRILDQTAAPPTLRDPAPLRLIADRISEQALELAAQSARRGILQGICTPPALSDTRLAGTLIAGIQNSSGELNRACQVHTATISLVSPPMLSLPDGIRGLISALTKTGRSASSFGAVASATKELDPPPVLATTTGITRLIDDLASSREHGEFVERVSAAGSALASPPKIANPKPLADWLRNWAIQEQSAATGEQRSRLLERCEQPPKLDAPEALRSRVEEIVKADQGCRQLLKEASRLQGEIDEIKTALKDIDFCPTCGQSLSVDQLIMHQGHDGGDEQ